jgi:signal recognition particle GTPase
MGDFKVNRDKGITTEEALKQLYKEIDDQLLECEVSLEVFYNLLIDFIK